jgi:hypothetical protein
VFAALWEAGAGFGVLSPIRLSRTLSAVAGSASWSFSPLVARGRETTLFVSRSTTTNSTTGAAALLITVTDRVEKSVHVGPS